MARKAKCIGFGVFEEQYISKENQLLNIIYLELLRKHTPKLEEELQMTIKATVTGGKRAGAGRKKREVTAEMLADLKVLPIDVYCEKHKCSESFFLNLYYKNVSTEVVEKEIVVEKEADIFDGLLVDTHIMFTHGYDVWIKHVRTNYETQEAMMQDVLHQIQLKDHTQSEKIALFDMLKEIRLTRSTYDDSLFFAEENKFSIVGLLEFKKIVAHRARWVKEKRGYKTRVMKKEFGDIIKGDKK